MGLGVPEMMIILFLALLIFGPKKLPELGKSLGTGIREFKKASNELQRTLEEEIRLDDEKSKRPAQAAPAALPPVIEASPETIHSPAQDAVNAASDAVNAAPVPATAPADTVARGTESH